jgi:hypothetical protein
MVATYAMYLGHPQDISSCCVLIISLSSVFLRVLRVLKGVLHAIARVSVVHDLYNYRFLKK